MKQTTTYPAEHLISEQAASNSADGARAMLRSKSGFQTLVHKRTLNVIIALCFVNREALTSKTSADGHKCAFDLVIKIGNYFKNVL